MATHRSTSGKFTPEPIRNAPEILRFGRLVGSGCILPPEILPFGYFKQGVWYVQIADGRRANGRGKRSAVQEIFRFYYPFNTTELMATHRIGKVCKTQGCLNYRHYEVVNKGGMTQGETYMAQEQIINLLTQVLGEDETLTFGDASAAESFRMHIYRLKRKWKKENSPYYTRFEEVVIKKNKLHTNMLEFTTNGRCFEDALAKFAAPPPLPSGTIDEPMSVDEKEYLDDVIRGRDHGKEVLSSLGYTPKMGVELTSYDACYGKAVAGGVLTKEEEKILERGPDIPTP